MGTATATKKKANVVEEDEVINYHPDVDWGDLLEGFASDGGNVLFIKKQVRVRLAPFTDVKQLFLPVTNIFKGKTSTKYIVKVYHLDEVQEGTPRAKAMLVSKRDARQIITMQQEGWELFDAKMGFALRLVRSGEGQQSTVTMTPSPKPRPLSTDELMELDEVDMAKIAEEYSKSQERRANGNGNDRTEPEEAADDYN